MTQYNMLNIKLSNSQLNKLKSLIKNGTEVTLNLSSKLIGSSNVETSFPHKMLLTNTQVSKIHEAFANSSSPNIKFSKTHLPKMIELGGFPLYEFNGTVNKGLESMPKYIDHKLKIFLKDKEKNFDTIKTVDNSR